MLFADYFRKNSSKLLKSGFCFISFFGLGGCAMLLGSALLDLQILAQEPFEKISQLIPARAIGYLFGGAMSGFLERYADQNLIIFVSNFFAGVFIALTPWFQNFYGIFTCILFSGISQGVFDIFCNTYVLNIWGDQATNYVQLLHGSFGLGALLAPMVIRPFLLPLATQFNSTEEDTSDAAILGSYSPDDVQIQWPFLAVGIILMGNAFAFLMFFVKERSQKMEEKQEPIEGPESMKKVVEVRKEIENSQILRWKRYTGAVMVAIIANLTFGLENVVGSCAPAFGVKSDLRMSKKEGAALVTLFWAVFTFYRIIFIILTSFFKERHVLYASFAFILAGVGVMVPHAAFDSLYTYISFVLIGIGLSPTFPASLGCLQSYFHVTSRMASFIYINGSIGESIHPWLAAKLMNTAPITFVYYLGILSLLKVAACFFLPIVCDKLTNDKEKVEASLERSASIRSSIRRM